MARFETWDAGGDNLYLYTEDREIKKELSRDYATAGTYYRDKGCYGWQFLIRKRVLPFLKKRFQSAEGHSKHEKKEPKNSTLNYNELQADNFENPILEPKNSEDERNV